MSIPLVYLIVFLAASWNNRQNFHAVRKEDKEKREGRKRKKKREREDECQTKQSPL